MLIVRVYKGDRVLTENVYEQFPLTVGRDPSADVCLWNETVSNQHARINVDERGNYVMEDLNSLNGLYRRGRKVSKIDLRGTTQLYVGEVKVEVAVSHSQKTQEIRPEVLERIRSAGDPKRMMLTLALAVWVVALSTLFQLRVLNTTEPNWLGTMTVTMVAMAGFFGVALLVFTTARPLNREVSYVKVVEGFLIIGLTDIFLDTLHPLVYYLGSLPLLFYEWLARVVFFCVVVVVLARLMGWAKTRKRKMIIAATTSVLVTVVLLTVHLNLNRYGLSAGNATLEPPWGNFVGPTEGMESLYKASDELYTAAVQEAEKRERLQSKRRETSRP